VRYGRFEFGLMEAWDPESVEELGSGPDVSVDQAFGLMMDRVCAESGIPRRGPWVMHTDAECDVSEQRITLRIELLVKSCSRCSQLPVN